MKQLAIIEDNHTDALCIQKWCLDLPNIRLIKHFYNGFDAIHDSQIFLADIVVVDMHLPLICGLNTISLLLEKKINGKIIGTSHAFNSKHLLKLKEFGVHGYSEKRKEPFLEVLSLVSSGKCGLEHINFEEWDKRTKSFKLHEKDVDERLNLLNPHYKNILLYTYQGLTTSDMAVKMRLKKHTIEQYRSTMLQQLGFTNMCQATAWAIFHKIIITSELPPPPQN